MRQRATVDQEAFGWYSGEPPSPMEAAYHFAEQAERDPAKRCVYGEALETFLATCWNIHPATSNARRDRNRVEHDARAAMNPPDSIC